MEQFHRTVDIVTVLHEAIESQDQQSCIRLLSQGASASSTTLDGSNAFHVCAGTGNAAIFQCLLDCCLDEELESSLSHVNSAGVTAFGISIVQGHVDIVRCILKRKVTPSFRSSAWSPLHNAVYYNQQAILLLLLDYGVDVNLTDKHGCTALHTAVSDMYNGMPASARSMGKTSRISDLSLTEQLLTHKADTSIFNKKGHTVLHDCLLNQDVEILQFLLQFGVDVNLADKSGNSPLHLTVMLKRMDMSQMLLEHKAYPNTYSNHGNTPQYDAVRHDSMDLVRLQVDNNANVNYANEVRKKVSHLAALPYFVPNEAHLGKANVDKDTPLHIAVRYNLIHMVKYLLQSNVDVNLVNSDGNSPLHDAVRHNYVSIAQLLVANKACIDITNKEGDSLVHHAAKANHTVMMQFQSDHGVAIDTSNLKGHTPLSKALEVKSWHAAEWLVQRHVDQYKVPEFDVLYMLPCVQSGPVRLLRCLLAGKADVTVLHNADQNTYLHLAAIHGNTRAVDLLCKYYSLSDTELTQYQPPDPEYQEYLDFGPIPHV